MPSVRQTWRTFLENHVPDIAACDFFTVPTVTFRVLYVFIVLRHDRRQVVHFNVTTNPHAEWAAQQIINAFPYEEAPRFLIRDRDGTYGEYTFDVAERTVWLDYNERHMESDHSMHVF